VRIHLSLNGNLDLEAMPMHLPALVPIGNIRKRLGGFKGKILGQTRAHALNVAGSPHLRARGKFQPLPAIV
jgi:hypothetical protein